MKDGSVGIIDPITQEDVLGPDELAAQGLGSFDNERVRDEPRPGQPRPRWATRTTGWWPTSASCGARSIPRSGRPSAGAPGRAAEPAASGVSPSRPPWPAVDLDGLRARQAAVESEIKGLEARHRRPGERAGTGRRACTRVDDVAAAADAAGDAAASDALKAKLAAHQVGAASCPPPCPPATSTRAARSCWAPSTPSRRPIPSSSCGPTTCAGAWPRCGPATRGAEVLKRALDQRKADLLRVGDEIALREAGVAPPASALLAGEQRALRDALRERPGAPRPICPRARRPRPTLTAEERERKKQSVEALRALRAPSATSSQDAAFTPHDRRRGRVLVRSTFAHGPHLKQAECARCHAGVEKSKKSRPT